jgi:hypothetical protein
LEITPELMSVLLLMDDSIASDTPLEVLEGIPDLGLGLLTRPPLTDFSRYLKDPVCRRLRVPRRLAEFFIESFAEDEPPEQLHLSPKRFPVSGGLLKFRLPAVVPVIVTGEERQLVFGFFDTPLLASTETEGIFKRLLTVLSQRTLLTAHFRRVDERGFDPNLIDVFSSELDVRVLVQSGPVNRELECRDVTIFVMKSHWDEELGGLVRSKLGELYQTIALNYCRKCGLLFSADDGEGCVTTSHRGHKIQFDNGLWELVEFEDGDDEPITIVRWSCCGEMPTDEPGCVSAPAGSHELDPARPYSSEEYGEERMLS